MSITFKSNGQTFTVKPGDSNQRPFVTELIRRNVNFKPEGFSFRLPADITLMTLSATKLSVNSVSIPNTPVLASVEINLPTALHGKGFSTHIAIFKEVLLQLPDGCFPANNAAISISVEALNDAIEKAFQCSVQGYEETNRITFNGFDYEISGLPASIFLTRQIHPDASEDSLKNPAKILLTKHELEITYPDKVSPVAFSCAIRINGYKWCQTDVFVSQEKTKALFTTLLEILDRSGSFQAATADLIKAVLDSTNRKE